MMLDAILEKPSVSARLRAWRSIAGLAACRTRRSCHGDFGFHCSVVKSIQKVAGRRVGASRRPAVRLSSSASAPRIE
jgi:hypothetical protein